MEKSNKKRVLFLSNTIAHYRVPIYNMIAEKYDLTFIYSLEAKKSTIDQCNFKVLFLPVLKIWKFYKHKTNIYKICKNFDVVIADEDIAWLDYITLTLRKNRKFRLIYWGIGVPASYTRRYGEASKFHYWLFKFFYKKADGIIFYSSKPINLYINWGIPKHKLYVANNTVEIKQIPYSSVKRTDLLFIGSLYKQKGIFSLLEAYLNAFNNNSSIPNLNIVGGGEELDKIKEWVNGKNLKSKINILGPIYEENKKCEIFSKSIACISPNQAGLSVLESMGYGIPFITIKNAITGGESFNIENNYNGLILDSLDELKDIILDINNNKDKFLKMGENAYDFYWKYRKPSDMAQGAINAIENV